MRIIFISLLLLASSFSMPLHAQWLRRVLSEKTPAIYPAAGMTDGQAAFNISLQRATRQAVARQNRAAQCVPLTAPLNRAVFTVKENIPLSRVWNGRPVTAFAFQVTRNGKQDVWGITAAQYGLKQPKIVLPSGQEAPSTIQVKGNAQMSDLVLFPIPQELADQITPLPLAEQMPNPGEEVSSVAFFEDNFHLSTNRIVTEVAPHRSTASQTLEAGTDLDGACGGPVLNNQGKVVGMQVANSVENQTGSFIPLSHIRNALNAYYKDGHSSRPIVFNGAALGRLRPNEAVSKIEVWNGNKRLKVVHAKDFPDNVRYNHLERLVDIGGGETAIIYIERTPLNAKDPNQHKQSFRILVHLMSGHISVHRNHFYTLFPNR